MVVLWAVYSQCLSDKTVYVLICFQLWNICETHTFFLQLHLIAFFTYSSVPLFTLVCVWTSHILRFPVTQGKLVILSLKPTISQKTLICHCCNCSLLSPLCDGLLSKYMFSYFFQICSLTPTLSSTVEYLYFTCTPDQRYLLLCIASHVERIVVTWAKYRMVVEEAAFDKDSQTVSVGDFSPHSSTLAF